MWHSRPRLCFRSVRDDSPDPSYFRGELIDVSDVYVDKGYRGHGCDRPTRVHIAAGSSSNKLSRSERKRRRRRSAIEPKIGHLKSDHRAGRCFLSGLEGDAINIVLAAAAANLRKLPAGFCLALRAWLASLASLACPRELFRTPPRPDAIAA